MKISGRISLAIVLAMMAPVVSIANAQNSNPNSARALTPEQVQQRNEQLQGSQEMQRRQINSMKRGVDKLKGAQTAQGRTITTLTTQQGAQKGQITDLKNKQDAQGGQISTFNKTTRDLAEANAKEKARTTHLMYLMFGIALIALASGGLVVFGAFVLRAHMKKYGSKDVVLHNPDMNDFKHSYDKYLEVCKAANREPVDVFTIPFEIEIFRDEEKGLMLEGTVNNFRAEWTKGEKFPRIYWHNQEVRYDQRNKYAVWVLRAGQLKPESESAKADTSTHSVVTMAKRVNE